MLITRRFVLLNMSKTGSTFARTAIKRLYTSRRLHLISRVATGIGWGEPVLRELSLPNMRERGREAFADQHGMFAQIPGWASNRPVVSVVRNPFDRYVSQYRFGWWKRVPLLDVASLCATFPRWPELSFAEFLEYKDMVLSFYLPEGCDACGKLGVQTLEFSLMFTKSPADFVINLGDSLLLQSKYRSFFPSHLTLLRTERLNDDLWLWLNELGYPARSIEFIRQMKRVAPPVGKMRDPSDDWRTYYTRELTAHVVARDKFLLKILVDLNLGDAAHWPDDVSRGM